MVVEVQVPEGHVQQMVVSEILDHIQDHENHVNEKNHIERLKNTLDHVVVLSQEAESHIAVISTLVLVIVEVVAVAVGLCTEVADILAADLDLTRVPVIRVNVKGTFIDHILAVRCRLEDVMLVTETILLLLDV